MKKSPTYEIVNIILRRGNERGLIREWFDGMKTWAEANAGQDAAALRTWLGIVKPRPFYTAEELSAFWPALKLTLGLEARMTEPPSPNRLANELKFHGLPFFSVGLTVYFVVDHIHKWRKNPPTQEEFENALLNG